MIRAAPFFTEEFLRHFRDPLNVGDVEAAAGTGEARSEMCGDFVRITISVDGGVISNAMFRVYGCAAAIAGASLATETAKGLSLDEAASISAEDLASRFGGVPETKMKCLETVCGALRGAINNVVKHRLS